MEGLKSLINAKKRKTGEIEAKSLRLKAPSPLTSTAGSKKAAETPVCSSSSFESVEVSATNPSHQLSEHPETVSDSENGGKRTLASVLKDITSCGSSSESFSSLPDSDTQIIFTFLRSLNEPCTLFGESPIQRIHRARGLVNHSQRVEEISTDHLSLHRSKVSYDADVSLVNGFDIRDVDQQSAEIVRWLRFVLETWLAFIKRDTVKLGEEIKSVSGDMHMFKQTLDALKTLLELIKSGGLDSNIKAALCDIALLAVRGAYPQANAQFLKLSIGNKPWPIGVGNCFIQERASMDRIATSKHLLNDETTRRFIQAIKRLLTKAEELGLGLSSMYYV
jgi:pre-mRNA-splicing factor 18